MPTRRRAMLIIAALFVLALLSISLALMAGSISVPFRDVVLSLFDAQGNGSSEVVRNLPGMPLGTTA